jgi:branched-chain amino acid transport system substrate-binding protein
VYDQSYQASSSDLSALIVGLQKSGAEVLFPTSYTQDAKLIFNTCVQYNYYPLIVGGGAGLLYPAFAADLGDAVNGILSTSSHNYDAKTIRDNPTYHDIGERFEKRFGYFMPEQGVSAFNAVLMISMALEATGSTDGPKVRDAIRAINTTTLTPGGHMKFNAEGWNTAGVAVMNQWQKDPDGKYRLHAVYPPSERTVDFFLPDLLKQKATKQP